LDRQGHLAEHLPGAGLRRWTSGASPDRLFRRESPPLRGGWKRGERTQAIGRSRGGRTTKIHALTDASCRPIAFLLTGGQVADCTAADTLLEVLPQTDILHGDKGYDSNAVRRKIESKGVAPNIPPKINRRWKNCFSPYLYRDRNAIERMFCRLKDFRRIATRYDRRAVNFLASVCIAATISYWL
jgi:transposase